ncbi:MAG: site-specific integrase [Acidimicrobiales bacterium]
MAHAERSERPRSTGALSLRKRGSGGIYLVRPDVYRIDVEVHRDSVTGRRRRVSRTVYGTQEDAEVALAKLKLADHEKRLSQTATNVRSVRALLELYLQEAVVGRVHLAPKTIVTSRSAANTMSSTILPDGRAFGDLRLSRLTWREIEEMYAAMQAAGAGPDWTRRCGTVLSRALERGKKHGLLDTNPERDADRPKSVRSKPFAPLGEDVQRLLAHIGGKDPELADMGAILAGTGMRTSELLALWWRDLDTAAGEVHLAWAVVDGGPGVGVKRQPTKRSDWRDVPLTQTALAAFQRQRHRREASGDSVGPDDYIFPGAKHASAPHRPDTLSDRWLEHRGPSPITLLALRHFAATKMLDAGVSYRTVADLLGNSESTLRLHYDGRTDVGKRKAIAALEL